MERFGYFNNSSMVLLLFIIFLRPLSLISGNIHISSLNLLQIYYIASSWFLLLILCINLKHIKIDFINILLVFFTLYIVANAYIIEGHTGYVARIILPLLIFFVIRAVPKSKKEIKNILLAFILGYTIPILGSFLLIITGKSPGFQTAIGLIKEQGLFLRPHNFAHTMAFFSFLCCIFLILYKKNISIIKKKLLYILLLLSLINLFFSHVRVAYTGCIIFWSIFLFFCNRKTFFLLSILGIITGLFFFKNDIYIALFQSAVANDPHNINAVSSGRIEIWTHNFSLWHKLPIEYKLIGVGFGAEAHKLSFINDIFWPSHNDYLSYLIHGGIIGCFILLIIYITLAIKIYTSNLTRKLKIYFAAFLIAVLVMNALSNSYLTRPEAIQYFWFIMGLHYKLSELNETTQK